MKLSGRLHITRRRLYALGVCGGLAVSAIGGVASCTDPTGLNIAKVGGSSSGTPIIQVSFNENCAAGDDWIPGNGGPPPPVRMFEPTPHPDTECPFYRGAYQNFLIATTPEANGAPALLRYATLFDAFTSSYPTGFVRNSGSTDPNKSPAPYENPGGAMAAAAVLNGPPTGLSMFGIVHQAGQRNILVDQDHHTLYYTVSMNQAMVDFIRTNKLDTVKGINAVDPNLELPPGIVLTKSAWKDIDPRDFPDSNGKLGTPNGIVPKPTDFASDPGDFSNYITATVWLPWLSLNTTTNKVEEDPDHPVLRKVALVAFHSVYSYPGHPELVWGSVQHVNIKETDPDVQAFAGISQLGMPDSQPSTSGPGGLPSLPDPNDPQNANVTTPVSMHKFLLYSPGTPENEANAALDDSALKFDPATQTFGTVHNVYRMFPGSKANTLTPDSAVFSLNSNLNAMFDTAIKSGAIDPNKDKRQNYRLLAAVWMDKPALFSLGAKNPQTGTYSGVSLQNDDQTNFLALEGALTPPRFHPEITQGVTCGTPTGTNGQPPLSGDVPGATGFNNTVPGCDTRYDDLLLPDAGNPTPFQALPDGGITTDPGVAFANHIIGTDSPFSLLGGEDRMSSTSMETFTQNNTFKNCFSCHNTQPINELGVSADPECLPPSPGPGCPLTTIPFAAKINVTHFFSEFVVTENAAQARAMARSGN